MDTWDYYEDDPRYYSRKNWWRQVKDSLKKMREYWREERQLIINARFGSHTNEYRNIAHLGDFNGIIISVQDKEEDLPPHFHFYRSNDYISDYGRGGGCILIKEPAYYDYASHNERILSNEIGGLIDFLSSDHSEIWKTILVYWNAGDPKELLPLDLQMPDYTQLDK